MSTLSEIGSGAALIAILGASNAAGQIDQGFSEQELIDPWLRAKAVVASLGPLLDSTTTRDQGGRVDADLSKLDDELSGLQTELEKVAIRIVAVPEFAYEASDKSTELSRLVLDIEQSFDSLFDALKIRDRLDVKAMQSSMSALRQALSQKNRFERDVIRVIGSGSKNEMQTLAGQWWRVGESVEGVKVAVEGLRPRPAVGSDK